MKEEGDGMIAIKI